MRDHSGVVVHDRSVLVMYGAVPSHERAVTPVLSRNQLGLVVQKLVGMAEVDPPSRPVQLETVNESSEEEQKGGSVQGGVMMV